MCIVNYKYVVNIVLFIEGLLSSLTGNFCCRMGRCYAAIPDRVILVKDNETSNNWLKLGRTSK